LAARAAGAIVQSVATRDRPQAIAQPSGTVSLLFSDIEGSTALLQRIGASRYGEVLARHRELMRSAFVGEAGYEVDSEGDSFFVAFATAKQAVAAAQRAQEALHGEVWPDDVDLRVRIGIHTGEPSVAAPKYVGIDVHRAARIMASAHGGQVVVSSTTHELASEFPLRSLGAHRLRDFPEPEQLYQLGEASFPPLKTLTAANLPRPPSSFVGRNTELHDVLSRLSGGARLVTLTGPGGAGKTRLALEIATVLASEHAAAVYWISLAAVRDASLVPESIARTIGGRGDLARHIGEAELTLLLDNLEQVIDAAPALAELLRACPNLTLLVTSREVLRLEGEVEYPVPPLAADDAVTLFCERAPHTPAGDIQELCDRLDNLPLAIELAAARTRALSPAQIVERLSQRLDLLRAGRDTDARHQTLRATIAWSYDLLTEHEQRLFRRLSVFSGGFTLKAAEAIAEADLDLLQSLVEKSLLRYADERYWLLETVRAFSAEKLALEGDTDVRGAHMSWFAHELSSREYALRNDEDEALQFAEAELENANAALEYALDTRSGADVARLLWGTFKAWGSFGRFREGMRWADAAIEANLDVEGSLRVCLLAASADLLRNSSDQDFDRVRYLYEEAVSAADGLTDDVLPGGRPLRALAISVRASISDVALRAGDLGGARASAEAALEDARAQGDPHGLSRALDSAACVSFVTGDIPNALAAATERLRVVNALGRAGDASDALTLIAQCELERGDDAAAAAALAAAIERIRDHPTRVAYGNNVFIAAASLALAHGEVASASAFARLAVKEGEGLSVEPERALILARLQTALADAAPSEFASADDALDSAFELAQGAASPD
jgi:predicted ATPase/class 3 adenylate cyclase